jgi:hypothetical protein
VPGRVHPGTAAVPPSTALSASTLRHTIVLSICVDVRRGAAVLRAALYGMTTSSTSTTSTPRVLPSLPLHRAPERYNL